MVILFSCTGPGTYQAFYEVISDELPGRQYKPLDKSFYDNEEYSFLVLKFGNKSPIKLVLVNSADGLDHWITSDKRSLYTNQYGRVVRTDGFEHDISITGFYNQNLVQLKKGKYFYDFYDPRLHKISAEDIFLEFKSKTYEIFKGDLIKADEIIYLSKVPAINWVFENTYLEYNGKLLFSSQEIHPFDGRLDLYFFYK